MPLAYQRHFNERAIAESEAFNHEALTYLDETFQEPVTAALEACLDEQPPDPVRFVAQRIALEGQAQGTSRAEAKRNEGFTLNFDDGLHCEVTPLRADAKPAECIAGLPIVRLLMPTLYDMESAMRMLTDGTFPSESVGPPSREGDGTASLGATPVLVVVEPPPAPEDIVFLKGIPYRHTLSEVIEYHRRRGTRLGSGGAPDLQEEKAASPRCDESAREQALAKLKVSLGDDLVGFEEAMATLVASTKQQCVSVVTLPSIQKDYMDVFDIIDAGFLQLTHPRLMQALTKGARSACSDSDAALMAWDHGRPPAVMLASFHCANAPLTLARVLSAFTPYYETWQLREVASMRRANVALVKQYDLKACSEYWRGVHERREAFDAADSGALAAAPAAGSGGARRAVGPGKRRSNGTRPPSATVAVTDKATATAAVAAVEAPTPPHRQRSREGRRQQEDTAFLGVVRALETLAATSVQAVFRGFQSRKALRALRTAPDSAAPGARQRRMDRCERFDTPYPSSLPPLLALVAEHIGEVHGELFGNYEATPGPEPRGRPVFVPHHVHGGGGDEGAEKWQVRIATLPPARVCERRPHMNPVQRVLDYHRLCGCDTLNEALLTQKQLSGLSTLQHRAYNQLKSVALDILHVAHAELFHRGLLPLDYVSFSRFVRRYHAPVLSWFSQPHLVSRAALSQRCDEARWLTRQRAAVAMADTSSVAHERVLLCGCGAAATAFLPSPSSHDHPVPCAKVAEHVFLTAAAQPMGLYEEAIRRVAHDLRLGAGDSEERSAATLASASGTVTPATVTPRFVDEGADSEGKEERRSRSGGACDITVVNLCPHPTVYVNGRAIVLAPVSASQRVAGRPDSNHIVLRGRAKQAEEAASGEAADSLANTVNDAAADADNVTTLEADELPPRATAEAAQGELDRRRSYSQVIDGIVFRRRSQVRAADLPRSMEDSVASSTMESLKPQTLMTGAGEEIGSQEAGEAEPCHLKDTRRHTCASLSSLLGGGSLTREERVLAKGIRATLSELNALIVFEQPGAGRYTTYTSAMRAGVLQPRTIPLEEMFADAKEAAREQQRQHQLQWRAEESPLHGDDSASGTPPRAGRARSHRSSPREANRGAGSPRAEALADQRVGEYSASGSGAVSPVESGSSPAGQIESPVSEGASHVVRAVVNLSDAVVPSSAAFEKLSSSLFDSEATRVSYRRTWLPAGLCGAAWLQRVELYMEVVLADLKRKQKLQQQRSSVSKARPATTRGTGAILLTVQPDCADQTLFVAAAVLLSHAVESAAAQRSISGTALPPTLSAGTSAAPVRDVGFIGDFCDLLRRSVGKAGVDVDECLGRVCQVLQALQEQQQQQQQQRRRGCCDEDDDSDDDVAFFTLSSILEDVQQAEQEPNVTRCRAYILRAVQRSEHLCWLLLIEVFLAVPFTKPSLEVTRDASLPSFASFVASVDGAVAWIESMDPWAAKRSACPDATHVRYTNGLRRWDCADYICFGAI